MGGVNEEGRKRKQTLHRENFFRTQFLLSFFSNS
jgi:hypothetical protein